MANEWYRFGPQPATLSGAAPTPLYYLSFTDELGTAEITHTYNPATAAWTVVNAARVSLAISADRFALSIDGHEVFIVGGGMLSAASFTTDQIPLHGSVSFMVQFGASPERWATVSSSGVVSVPLLLERTLTADAAAFRFTTDGALVAQLGRSALETLELNTIEYFLAWGGGEDLFIFGTDVYWKL